MGSLLCRASAVFVCAPSQFKASWYWFSNESHIFMALSCLQCLYYYEVQKLTAIQINWYPFLSSTWREFDPDTANVVCISASLVFPYMVSISLGFYYMVMLQIFFTKCKHHCSGCGVAMGCFECCIVPGTAYVTSQYYGRYCFTEYARTWSEHLSMY